MNAATSRLMTGPPPPQKKSWMVGKVSFCFIRKEKWHLTRSVFTFYNYFIQRNKDNSTHSSKPLKQSFVPHFLMQACKLISRSYLNEAILRKRFAQIVIDFPWSKTATYFMTNTNPISFPWIHSTPKEKQPSVMKRSGEIGLGGHELQAWETFSSCQFGFVSVRLREQGKKKKKNVSELQWLFFSHVPYLTPMQ